MMATEIDSSCSLSVDLLLDTLENKDYLKSDSFNTNFKSEKKLSKILGDFDCWLSGLCRTRFLKVDQEEAGACYEILKNLKKNVAYALDNIWRSYRKYEYNYICIVCKQTIEVRRLEDTWETLQNHEHFEKLYVDFISGKIVCQPDEHKAAIKNRTTFVNLPANVNTELKSETPAWLREAMKRYPGLNLEQNLPDAESSRAHHDSSLVRSDNKSVSSLSTNTVLSSSNSSDTVNGIEALDSSSSKPETDFKFNFNVGYFEEIEQTLYPDALMRIARQADGLNEYTVQKTGPCRAICLVCICELKYARKISKQNILEHVLGQRHLRSCSSEELLSALNTYHDTFRKEGISYQAHSIYFVPESKSFLKCSLCNVKVAYSALKFHIPTEKHRKRVISAATQCRLGSKIYFQNVLDIQLEDYKVTLPPVAPQKSKVSSSAADKRMNGGTPKKYVKPIPGSSASSDNQRIIHKPIKSVKNPTGKELDDLIPNRYRSHLKLFSKTDKVFRCNKCEVIVQATTLGLKNHIISSQHLLLSMTTLPKFEFYCEICNSIFANENAWKAHFEKPVERHASMAESRKEKVTEYECPGCKMVIFGDEISLMRHAPNKDGKEHKKDIAIPDKVMSMFKSREFISEQGEQLRAEANQVLDEQDPTFLCCEALEKVLSTVYPDCKAYPFGSRISGLGNKDSDLDVFLDTGDMYMGMKNQDTRSQITFLNKCKGAFSKEKQKDEFTHIVAIPSARTPIIKLWHRPSDLDCDISFRHGLSVENTKFLKYCIKVQPQLQMLVLLLKKWSYYCGFYEHITTYAFAMMAIFYMQVKNFLPSVVCIRRLNPTASLLIDGWEAFDDTLPPDQLQKHIKECPFDLTKLLADFFAYYMNFDYQKDVVCPLLGETIVKDLFTPNGRELPEAMITYVRKLNTEEYPETFRSRSEICIQDPFDLTHNLTKACPQWVVKKLKKLCELSFNHLTSLV